jgi:ribokinase
MQKDILIVAVGSINADLVAEKSVTAQRANYAYGSNFEMNLGGKSLNVALTALALCNDVALISRIGNDIFGLEILNKAMKDGLITQYITIDEQAHTGIGHVRVDENGQYDTIVINGANWNLIEEDIDTFISDGYRPKFAIFNFETDINLLKKVIPKFKQINSQIVMNFSPIVNNMRDLMNLTDIAVLNLAEAQQILESSESNAEDLLKKLKSFGPKIVVITLGGDGAIAMNSDGLVIKVPAQVAKVKNTVGAGDGFLACLIYSIAQELSLEQSLINATYVGKIICSKSEASLSAKDVLVLNSEPSFIRKIKTTLSSKG